MDQINQRKKLISQFIWPSLVVMLFVSNTVTIYQYYKLKVSLNKSRATEAVQKESNVDSPPPYKSDLILVAEWKLYENPDKGYLIRYPPDWQRIIPDSLNDFEIQNLEIRERVVGGIKPNPSRLPLKEWLETQWVDGKLSGKEIASFKDYSMNEFPTILSEETQLAYVDIGNREILSLQWLGCTSSGCVPGTRKGPFTTLDYMLNTVRKFPLAPYQDNLCGWSVGRPNNWLVQKIDISITAPATQEIIEGNSIRFMNLFPVGFDIPKGNQPTKFGIFNVSCAKNKNGLNLEGFIDWYIKDTDDFQVKIESNIPWQIGNLSARKVSGEFIPSFEPHGGRPWKFEIIFTTDKERLVVIELDPDINQEVRKEIDQILSTFKFLN